MKKHTPEMHEDDWDYNQKAWENFVENLPNQYGYEDVMDFREYFQNLASVDENVINLEHFIAERSIK